MRAGAVRIESRGEGDLPLLEKLTGDPEMMEHLGGPESPEKIAERQARYEPADSGMFKTERLTVKRAPSGPLASCASSCP